MVGENDESSMTVPLNRVLPLALPLLASLDGADFFVGLFRGRPFGLPGGTTFFFVFRPVDEEEGFEESLPFFDELLVALPPRPARLLPGPLRLL